ncbi:MAG: hypothetical protein UW86_C0003G0033 [Microgenomates group bacterium GW2011_GWA1_Microgenomates_45_10]|nr:MAG: hypothetical protein UW73_C0015G0033 [Microgenomates group bacterium GW2011_GWB1_44_8]KKT87388.1 MAG: hypothetical protein UW86_C0003G0033 [Microgenomates group bacterium GW2011_GWA1_Microgenomates_45_10]
MAAPESVTQLRLPETPDMIGKVARDIPYALFIRHPTLLTIQIAIVYSRFAKTPLGAREFDAGTGEEGDVDEYNKGYIKEPYAISAETLREGALEKLIVKAGSFTWNDISSLITSLGYSNREWLANIWGKKSDEWEPARRHPLDPDLPQRAVFTVINSCVMLVGETMAHIPMMDYRCPVSVANLARIVGDLRLQYQNGWILESGASYHFVSSHIIDPDGWRKWLETMADNPLIDPGFINASRGRDYSSLRITSRREYRGWRLVPNNSRQMQIDRPVKFIVPSRPVPRIVAVV